VTRDSTSLWECADCFREWLVRRCSKCGGMSDTSPSIKIGNYWTCDFCRGTHQVTRREPPACVATTADLYKQALGRGADYALGDQILWGFTVIGGYGWSLPANTRVTVALAEDQMTLASIPLDLAGGVVAPYDYLLDFEFSGGATSRGGGFLGGGFGLQGAVEGMIVASVLNSLTSKTTINSIVRISGSDGETFLHHGVSLPDELRRLFGPAVNAVKHRSADRGRQGEPESNDLVGQLERLARLREAGALTEAEFQSAKTRLLVT
jgi:hypothetical protein